MEYYIDFSYEAIVLAYPEFIDVIEPLYSKFRVEYEKKQKNNTFGL